MVHFIVADHLGTTSLVLDSQGDKVAESRHLPYGGERWRWPEEGIFQKTCALPGILVDSLRSNCRHWPGGRGKLAFDLSPEEGTGLVRVLEAVLENTTAMTGQAELDWSEASDEETAFLAILRRMVHCA